MNDIKIDNVEYNEIVKVYEENKKNKKNKLSIFKLNLSLFSYNKGTLSMLHHILSNNNISINIYH